MKQRELFKVTTKIADFFIIGSSLDAVRNDVEALLNIGDYGHSSDRRMISIERIGDVLAPRQNGARPVFTKETSFIDASQFSGILSVYRGGSKNKTNILDDDKL